MTKTISLAAYVLRMKEVRADNWGTMDLDGPLDGWSMINDYMKNRMRQLVNLQKMGSTNKKELVARCFKIMGARVDKKKCTIAGLVRAGNFGRAEDIVDTQTEKTSHRKKTNEAAMSPFYFFFQFPRNDTRAIWIVQRSGTSGFKGAMEQDMRRFCHQNDITLGIDFLSNPKIIEQYLKHGELTEIRVIAHKTAKESREILRDSRVDGEKMANGTKLDIRLTSPEGLIGKANRVLEVVRGKKQVSDLVEIHGLEDPEEVSVKVEANKHVKTFTITHEEEIPVGWDITDDVSYGSDNHPRFDSIDKLARKWCTELWPLLA